MESSASPALAESDSDAPTRTRAQGRKRKADKQAENREKPILRSAKKAANDPKEDIEPHTTARPENTHTKSGSSTTQQEDGAETPRKAASAKVQSAIAKAQEKTRKEAEMKNAMWGRIAKAVDEAMEAEAPGNIESHHIEHIVNAILDCALPSQQQVDETHTQSPAIGEKRGQYSRETQPHKTDRPQGKAATWAERATPNRQIVTGKPTLAQPLKGTRPDERLMVRLGKDSPHRGEHPFILQKKANAVLPNKIVIGKVAHINSGLALIPTPGTTAGQLEEHKEILARVFGACRAERNEKWAKYLVRSVPRRIRTLENLEDVTTEIAAEAFEQSCNMRPEWARWLIPQGADEEHLLEANMIFAVRPANIQRIPKVISLLGGMHVIVALPARETPTQCTNCGEWSHKKENCAKRGRCFYCSSDKHIFETHKCEEGDCIEGAPNCPHAPKCIVCNGPHNASYERCPLRPGYSKAKNSIVRLSNNEAAQIRGQQKALRSRLIRDNQLQAETATQTGAGINSATPASSPDTVQSPVSV